MTNPLSPSLSRCTMRRRTWPAALKACENKAMKTGSFAGERRFQRHIRPHCRMYERVDGRIHVLNKKNEGVSAARNDALDAAKGDFVQFLDSDDYLPPDATEKLVARALADDCDLVVARYYRVKAEKITVHGFLQDTGVMDQLDFARQLMEEPASFTTAFCGTNCTALPFCRKTTSAATRN